MFDDEFKDEEIDEDFIEHDKYIDLVINGEMLIDDLPAEENSLETLEKVYNELEICNEVAWEIIEDFNLLNKGKELTEESIVDYNQAIEKELLNRIEGLYSSDDIRGVFEKEEYREFLANEIDAIFFEILEILKTHKK